MAAFPIQQSSCSHAEEFKRRELPHHYIALHEFFRIPARVIAADDGRCHVPPETFPNAADENFIEMCIKRRKNRITVMGANKLFEFHTAFFVKIIIPFFAFPLHPEKRQAAHFHRDFIAKRLL